MCAPTLPTHLQPQQHAARLRARVAVVEERHVPARADGAQEAREGAWALWELHLVDALMRYLAHVGARAAAHQVPQVHLRGRWGAV